MKTLQKVILILSILTLTTENIWNIYTSYFHNTTSILDKTSENDIKNADSLNFLYEQYQKALEEEKNNKNKEIEKEPIDFDFSSNCFPFKTESAKYKNAIQRWEQTADLIKKTKIMWFAGLLLLLIGTIVYAKIDIWFGIAFIISGIIEMTWWQYPHYIFGTLMKINVQLLNMQMILSCITFLIIAFLWYKKDSFIEKTKS